MDGLDTDNSWKFFMSKVNYCIEKHVPVKRANVKFKKPKWMDQYCIAPDKAAYCVFTQFRGPENAIKIISVRTKTQ